jgi:hypothetical protein
MLSKSPAGRAPVAGVGAAAIRLLIAPIAIAATTGSMPFRTLSLMPVCADARLAT